MKKLFITACFLMLSSLEANMLAHDKAICLKQLEKATDTELWDVFLESQSKLFFDAEFMWMAKGPWWQKAESILEIGTGNGAYLDKLSHQFQDKTFKGIDKLPQPVKHANERYARSNLVFQEGDAEVLDTQLINSADIVLFRLTLQHLKDPVAALKNAAHYLRPNGYVLIIDSFDRAKKTSHSIPTIDEALQLVAEVQKKAGTENRLFTFELLQKLEDQQSPLSDLYEVFSSNIDTQGNVIGDSIRFQGDQHRPLYHKHNLLFLTLLHRTYHIPVDVSQGYDELQEYLHDPNAWTSPGTHLLVLKKKGNK